MDAKADYLENEDISSPQAEHVAAPTKKLRNPVPLFVLGGICIGILFLLLYILGVFNHWYRIAQAPVENATLLGASDFSTYYLGYINIQAEDGQIYSYPILSGGWYKIDTPTIESRACGRGFSLRFTALKRPFEVPYQCARVPGEHDLFSPPMLYFVLSPDGSVWQWENDNARDLIIWVPVFLILGVILGLSANLIWMIVRRIILRLKPGVTQATRLAVLAQEARVYRAIARIWSVFSIGILMWGRLNFAPGVFTTGTEYAGAVGMILAWFAPLPGGLIVVVVYLLRLVVQINRFNHFFVFPDFLQIITWVVPLNIVPEFILFMPGLLFLLAWLAKRKLKREQAASLA